MPDATRGVSLQEATAWCAEVTVSSDACGIRLLPAIGRAVTFFESLSIRRMADVSPAVAAAFVGARLGSGLPASVPTQHNRRTALRFLFRVARRHGCVVADPTVDLVLPPRSSLPTRPLVDSEIELCRDVAWWTSSRAAAAWALAEATARGAEIALVGPDDVDLDAGVVRLRGGARTEPRRAALTEWGVAALRRRTVRPRAPLSPMPGPGGGSPARCRRAGRSARCSSVPGSPVNLTSGRRRWRRGPAGARSTESGRIEDAARVMGVRSLDRAARLIGVSWTDR